MSSHMNRALLAEIRREAGRLVWESDGRESGFGVLASLGVLRRRGEGSALLGEFCRTVRGTRRRMTEGQRMALDRLTASAAEFYWFARCSKRP